MREERQPSGPAVTRPAAEEEMGATALGLHAASDMVRWGAIWSGFLLLLGALALLSIFGIALGLGTPEVGTAAVIWGAIVLIVSSFIGGWFAGWTSGLKGAATGALNGAIVWALLIAASVVLAALGAAGVLGALANLGIISPQVGPGAVPSPETLQVQAGAWGTLVALLLSLIAAVVGGVIGGGQRWPHEHVAD